MTTTLSENSGTYELNLSCETHGIGVSIEVNTNRLSLATIQSEVSQLVLNDGVLIENYAEGVDILTSHYADILVRTNTVPHMLDAFENIKKYFLSLNFTLNSHKKIPSSSDHEEIENDGELLLCPICNSKSMELKGDYTPPGDFEFNSGVWACEDCPAVVFEYYNDNSFLALKKLLN